ncbi:glutamine synthetase [Tabrizicola sp. BL-A-41-H6]|uniref:glutamine synthetase n=1 Tax=Tabrizicola sp. BL-A-41-H6 TaxID=3421107 RepID=UPI003D67283E
MVATLTAACTSDFSGLVRGKGFATSDLDKRVERGIGWTPTNVQITCFDTIAESPYGSFGDIVLMPDISTRTDARFPSGRSMSFVLGDIFTLEGARWECCTRGILAEAIHRFELVSGLRLMATFEHEFMLLGGVPTPGFSLSGFELNQTFGEAVFEALAGARIHPDSFLREYGPDQLEITVPPKPAMRAADEAVILREVVRAVARDMGRTATFAPLLAPDIVGNGVHIHLSLWTKDGRPVMHDPDGVGGLSQEGGAFVAGILRHVRAITALSAPSVVSPLRLTPHRWSAAFNNLAVQDREAAIRVCPVSAREHEARARAYNVEFRAADAAASPYLALASLMIAGTAGIEDRLATPHPTTEDLSLLTSDSLASQGLFRLPASLAEALDALVGDARLCGGLPERMPQIYAAHKRGEAVHVAKMNVVEQLRAYAQVY